MFRQLPPISFGGFRYVKSAYILEGLFTIYYLSGYWKSISNRRLRTMSRSLWSSRFNSWSSASKTPTTTAVEEEAASVAMERQRLATETERYFAGEQVKDQEALQWGEFALEYGAADPALSILAG